LNSSLMRTCGSTTRHSACSAWVSKCAFSLVRLRPIRFAEKLHMNKRRPNKRDFIGRSPAHHRCVDSIGYVRREREGVRRDLWRANPVVSICVPAFPNSKYLRFWTRLTVVDWYLRRIG
jgi:hypothetical protein